MAVPVLLVTGCLEAGKTTSLSLKNGCICCSLQGNLLRALSSVLRRGPAQDGWDCNVQR